MALCIEISKMANRVEAMYQDSDYHSTQWEGVCKRKPLALIHSGIGSLLNSLQKVGSPDTFKEIITKLDLFNVENNDFDPFVLAASHSKIAAESELQDDADTPICWWAYGAIGS